MVFLIILFVELWLKKVKFLSFRDFFLRFILILFVWVVIEELLLKGNPVVPPKPILIIDGIFFAVIVVAFTLVVLSYKRIVAKPHKTENDILKRRKRIHVISFLLAVFLSAIPFILNSWGFKVLNSFELTGYSTGEETIAKFVSSGMKAAMFLTIVVFLADNILSRIASDIHLYDETKDLEKFCLYLRSFNIDKNNEEKLICNMTRNLYPVYAIGDPNKMLQPNGAERIYVTDERWQEAVKELSGKSKLILIRIGQTDGTMWEIANVINSDMIKKVIFIAYNQDDYRFFSDSMSEKVHVMLPPAEFPDKGPVAIYFVEENECLTVKHFKITTEKDVKDMLNEYLKTAPELDNEYAQELEMRKHDWRYIFDKNRIPLKVRKSLNWGIISPIVNMRHWSIMCWIVLTIFMAFCVMMKSFIPIYIFGLFALLFGNRIEWAAAGWGGPTQFLRHQRREAKLLWLGIALGLFYSMIYFCLYLLVSANY